MKVLFFAYIRNYTKTKQIEVNGYDNLRDLLHKLCDLYGKEFTKKVFKGETLSDEIIILVNGRNINFLQDLDTPLKEDDEISIFPVVAGG